MPYHVVQRGSQWCVEKSDGSEKSMGCHDTKAKANAQMAALYANEPKAARAMRHLHLVGAVGQIRTATYDDREHLVVPVVAMVEGVVWAVNSDVPEFVPAEELAETPQQWNGRGCFAGHPADGGTQVTANTPRTLEQSFGILFDTVGADRILMSRRLEFNAWIDAAKAEKVGPEAVDVVRRLRALRDKLPGAQPVEVSVGCYVEAEDVDGEFDGKAYHGVWRNIVSDHLAFLAAGEQGACSVAAGCGAGRMATRHLITAEGIRREEDMGPAKPTPKGAKIHPSNPEHPAFRAADRGLMTRLMAYVSSLRGSEQDVSDRDLRQKIDAALRAVEPGYMGISEIYPDGTEDMATPHAIYDVCPADEWKMMRRGYTLSADGAIALDASAQHIEPVTTYEVVAAKEKEAPAAASAKPCSCGGQQARSSTEKPAKEVSMERKERIKALLDNEHNPLKDQKALDAATDETLAALELHAKNHQALVEGEAARKAEEAKLKETPKAAEAKPLTRAEIFAADPSIKSIVEREEAREVAEKDALVGQLKAASSVLTEEQLKARPIEELRTLAAFAKVEPTVDYSGRGVVVPPKAAAQATDFTPPNAYDADLKALQGKTTVN